MTAPQSFTLASRLRAGETVFTGWCGLGLPLLAETLAREGFSAVTLDQQHGAYDLATSAQALAAIRHAGAAPVVRVPLGEFATAARLLDLGLGCGRGAVECAHSLPYTLRDPGRVEAHGLSVRVHLLALADLRSDQCADGKTDEEREDDVDGAHDGTSSALVPESVLGPEPELRRMPLSAAMVSRTLVRISSASSGLVTSNSTAFSLP